MKIKNLFKFRKQEKQPDKLLEFADREVWLVTGCSSGLGKEICIELLRRGYKVAAGLRNIERLNSLKEEFKDSLLLLEMDVTDEKQINDAVKQTIQTFGKINILINNAGISNFCVIEEYDIEEAKKVLDTNLWGYIRTIKAILPYMREAKKGCIINISSLCGIEAFPGVTYYCTSKFAIEGFSESLRKEVKPLGIDVLLANLSTARTPISTKIDTPTPKIPEYKEILKDCIHILQNQIEYKSSKVSPQKAAISIINATEKQNKPNNLFLGSECTMMIRNKLNNMLKSLKSQEESASNVDYEE